MKIQTILREIHETYSNIEYSNFMKLSVISDINDRKFPVLLDIYNVFWEISNGSIGDFMEIESQRIESLINDESIEKEKLYILGLVYEKLFYNNYMDFIVWYKYEARKLAQIKRLYFKAGSKGGIIEARDRIFEILQDKHYKYIEEEDIKNKGCIYKYDWQLPQSDRYRTWIKPDEFGESSVINNLINRNFLISRNMYDEEWSGSCMNIEFQRIESLINDESIEKEELYILGLVYEYCFFNFLGRLIDEYSYPSFKIISKILKKIKKLYIKAGSKGGIIEARDKFFQLAQNEYDQKLDILDIVEDDYKWKSIMNFIGKSYKNIYNHSKICEINEDYWQSILLKYKKISNLIPTDEYDSDLIQTDEYDYENIPF